MNRNLLLLLLLNSSPAFSDSLCSIQEPWKFQESGEPWPELDSTVKNNECSKHHKDIIKYLKQNKLTDGDPGTLFTVDLNHDGKCEYFVSIPAWSGSGGTYWQIYAKSTESLFKNIGGIQAWDIKYLSQSNGYVQLESSDISGGHYIKHLTAYENGSYQIKKSNFYECNEDSASWVRTKTTHRK